MNLRIGNGFDTHPLIKGESLILGGVQILSKVGIKGHSDGDILTHSIIDSLLGATSNYDIGHHFPSTDSEFKNISSLKLLSKVVSMTTQKGYKVLNLDSTIILEHPSIKKKINLIRASLADCIKININSISIKATTNDGLGFIGRGEGISVLTTTLMIKH